MWNKNALTFYLLSLVAGFGLGGMHGLGIAALIDLVLIALSMIVTA